MGVVAPSDISKSLVYSFRDADLPTGMIGDHKRPLRVEFITKRGRSLDKLRAAQKEAIKKAKFSSAFHGHNPEKNKTLMRNKIKKNCISITTDWHYDEFNAIQTSLTETLPNDLSISELNIETSKK
ncbi:hypothetical protein TWF281_007877 [Arthrobotrys megalospora]